MKKKIIPIKQIIKDVEKLSIDPDKYESKLNKYSNITKDQKELFKRMSLNKIKSKLKNKNLNFDEYSKYKDLLYEKKYYSKYSSTINDIINKDYDSIYIRRTRRRKKMAAFFATGTLVIILGGFYFGNNRKNKSYNKEELTEAINTEEKTTEYIEYTSEEMDELFSKDNQEEQKITTEEETTEITNEITTESTTELYVEDDKTEEVVFDDGMIDYSKFGFLKEYYYKASEYIDTMENTLIDKKKRDETKEKAKEKAKEYIDFIFYGSEINGVTFDELKDDEKEKAYEQLQKINNKINEVDPDYLDNMGERYSRLKDLGSLTLDKAKEKVKEKAGEDYYNQAGEVKKDTIDTIKDTGKVVLKIIKDLKNE